MSDVIILTAEDFRQALPEFSDTTKYSNDFVNAKIEQSFCFISENNIGVLRDRCRKYAVELMTAHLITLADRILQNNSAGGIVASTSIDSISVSLVAPQNKSAFDYWLNQTAYGQQLLALLSSKAPAGLYFGGSHQRVLR